ncbi:MAG: hypothetical protein ACFFDW_17765, partial [Candidatus Thorarchaeota archaeon]
ISDPLFEQSTQLAAQVFGGIFMGYLAGGLAYANFFIKIKDLNYRIIFGGWIGVSLGSVFGSLFAGLMNIQNYIDLTSQILDPEISDPLFEQSTQLAAQVFGGIFMGFWGGAIVSGAIATILLHIFRDNKKVTYFFTKLQLYDIRYDIAKDLKDYFAFNPRMDTPSDSNIELNLADIDLMQEKEQKKHHIIIRILTEIVYFISPWEKALEKTRIAAYRDIFEKVCEENSLEIKDEKITIINQN